MAITKATQARALMTTHKKEIAKHTQEIEAKINTAAMGGHNQIEHAIPTKEWVKPVTDELKEAGYVVKQQAEGAFTISW